MRAFSWLNATTGTLRHFQLLHDYAQQVMLDYDFIVVTERLDESLVTLHFLLDIKLGDVLVLDSKTNYWHPFGGPNQGKCLKIPTKQVLPQVQDYLDSSAWYALNYGDYLLYEAASASLDKTIESIGRKRFQQKLNEFQQLKQHVNQICASEVIFPCAANGTVQPEGKVAANCYRKDWGCGYPCINRVVREGQ